MSHPLGEPYATSEEEVAAQKRNRLLSRSDEDIFNDMDNKNLPYRRGFPHLPSLPLQNVFNSIDQTFTRAQENELLKRARAIFDSQRLVTGYQRLVYRVPDDIVADDSADLRPYITFMFTVDMLKDAERIDRVIVKVRQSFQQVPAFNEVNIECLHIGCTVKPPTYAILPNDISVRMTSEAVVNFVIDHLKKERCQWLCIEVVRRGLVKNMAQCSPTVLITTPTADEERWYTTVLPEIRKRFVEEAPSFRIELLKADSIFAGRRRYKATNKVNDTSYESTVRMGSSVGIENKADFGATIGGYVTLCGGGQPEVQCGLTNWHVVEDDRLVKLLAPKSGALEPKNSILLQKPQNMVSPSLEDHQGYLGQLQAKMKNYQRYNKLGAPNWEPDSQKMYKDTNALYMKIEKTSRRIGYVHAASAYRSMKTPKYATNPKTGGVDKNKSKVNLTFVLDWALITVANPTSRRLGNVLPNKSPPEVRGNELSEDFICNEWSTFNVNKDNVMVAKVGRSSGWTFGHINAELIRINPNNVEFQGMAESYGATADEPAFCFAAVSDVDGQDFMEPGDSGSVVLHTKSGAWLGLLFGMTGEGNGMFIAIDRVFQDIKAVTGQGIRTPAFVKPDAIGLATYQLDPSE